MIIVAPAAARLSARTSSRVTFQIGSALAVIALLIFALAHTDPVKPAADLV